MGPKAPNGETKQDKFRTTSLGSICIKEGSSIAPTTAKALPKTQRQGTKRHPNHKKGNHEGQKSVAIPSSTSAIPAPFQMSANLKISNRQEIAWLTRLRRRIDVSDHTTDMTGSY
ncbi:hypothetical protein AMTR_s00161p00037480 [Amborella trichopoda]|uniref:Uncharacterized protein n=1 Tax=Amborella trichopoda TaxID=13333 RepID=W1PQY6_AMBTC|nr:hypothetical protein AMTR_s00161p00037480 [Amborella trichopoda]